MTKLVKAGYWVSSFALLILPIPMMVAGLMIAVLNFVKGSRKHGLIQFFLAIICGFLGTSLGSFMYNYFIR